MYIHAPLSTSFVSIFSAIVRGYTLWFNLIYFMACMTTLEMIEKDGFFHAASTALLPIVKMKNVNEFERKVTKSNNSVNRPMSSQSSHYFKRNV